MVGGSVGRWVSGKWWVGGSVVGGSVVLIKPQKTLVISVYHLMNVFVG